MKSQSKKSSLIPCLVFFIPVERNPFRISRKILSIILGNPIPAQNLITLFHSVEAFLLEIEKLHMTTVKIAP
jgi:hypothetical protein